LLAALRAARAGLHDPVRTTFCDRCGRRLDLDEFARVLQLNVISLVAMTQAVLLERVRAPSLPADLFDGATDTLISAESGGP
jgi:NAD(P)-dependent dehydrogenase (short-subunit alcohol dehydrogenase family)